MINLFTEIGNIKGIGPKKAVLFKKLGIFTPYDLLYHFPRSYTDFADVRFIYDAPLDDYSAVLCTVVEKLQPIIAGRSTVYKAIANDGRNNFLITIFNAEFQFSQLTPNVKIRIYGKVTYDSYKNMRQITSPRIMPAKSETLLEANYPLTAGISNAAMINSIKLALDLAGTHIEETLPQNVLDENGFPPLHSSVCSMHFPRTLDEAKQAKYRLAFEEMCAMQLGMLLKKRERIDVKCITMSQNVNMDDFYRSFPFEPTNAQKKAIVEITDDLCGTYPMNRLLQGDVGSGKTLVAAAACFLTAKNGYTSAIMAPTEILASQHYKTFSEFLEPLGVRVGLLTGSLTPKRKRELKEELAAGQYSVVIGTHALIQKDVEIPNLSLVITDEQHRFGVSQRAALSAVGSGEDYTVHKLLMSATPIPRTLSLMLYGELDLSVLDELPKNRKPIITKAYTGNSRDTVYTSIKKKLDDGKQAYIVCPRVTEQNANYNSQIANDETDELNSTLDLNSVLEYAETLRTGFFSGYRVEALHGRMSAAEKERIMGAFKSGETNILVSTTVVEVGVDVPNAVVMVIENCERFGLSQLHQLRGRVGRGEDESFCILLTDNPTKESVARMKIMCETSDGFLIAEEDLRQRGSGDFFGNAQHGLPSLKIADVADARLLNHARETAEKLLKDDPKLQKPENNKMKYEVLRLFSKGEE